MFCIKHHPAPGKLPLLSAAQRAALAGVVEAGPTLAVHGVVRWRILDLVAWLQATFDVTLSPHTLSRELRALGYRKLSARPRHHAQGRGCHRRFNRLNVRAFYPKTASHFSECAQKCDTAFSPQRPAHRLGLDLRHHLPGPRQGGGQHWRCRHACRHERPAFGRGRDRHADPFRRSQGRRQSLRATARPGAHGSQPSSRSLFSPKRRLHLNHNCHLFMRKKWRGICIVKQRNATPSYLRRSSILPSQLSLA